MGAFTQANERSFAFHLCNPFIENLSVYIGITPFMHYFKYVVQLNQCAATPPPGTRIKWLLLRGGRYWEGQAEKNYVYNLKSECFIMFWTIKVNLN
jgi:hypothetical protein